MNDKIPIRLNKHLALQLGVSRREADNLISQGRVRINGDVAILGARFFEGDTISYNNQALGADVGYRYIMLHKPIGYVCSRKDQGDAPTIYSLLPKELHNLKPVGRLDKDSSGVILLTNDGDFAFSMTHPKFSKRKLYIARLDHDLEPLHQQMISDYGVNLDDGPSKLSLERINDENRKVWNVAMTEGRNRQIRRTFGALGYTVVSLHRVQFGNYNLDDLEAGKTIQVQKQ